MANVKMTLNNTIKTGSSDQNGACSGQVRLIRRLAESFISYSAVRTACMPSTYRTPDATLGRGTGPNQ